MSTSWRDLLVAWLHDPPDKALDIRGHVSRARKYATAALGDTVSEAEMKDYSDVLASIAERLPSPRWEKLKVDIENGRLSTYHPLSAQERLLEQLPDTANSSVKDVVLAAIEDIVSGVSDTDARFLALWRLLPERLATGENTWFAHLPADTRVPDHSIWRHLDITAGLKGANAGGHHGAAFLSFSLGPVQSFIAAARSVRDLWSGSMLLGWLTWQGLLPVIRELGPTAVIYPSLCGIPWLDLWLGDEKELEEKIPVPDPQLLCTPCIPNRFLAVVPWGADGRAAKQLANACRLGALDAWRLIAKTVHDRLDNQWSDIDQAWDRRWTEQIESFFDVRTALLPWKPLNDDQSVGKLLAGDGGFEKAFPDATAVRELAQAIPDDEQPGYDQNNAGQWQARVELSARLMQATRAIRHIPPPTIPLNPLEQLPPKCSLLGTYEQMGPGSREDAERFWKRASKTVLDGVRLRDRERLCAVSLVKRFCGPCFFRDELGLETSDLRYDDTATVAATEWLARAGIDPTRERRHGQGWSGQWLYWPTRSGDDAEEACPQDLWARVKEARKPRNLGPPPAYYAVLMMDGDNMGQWLRGEMAPNVEQVFSKKATEYYSRLDGTRPGLGAKRPLGPAMHAAISEALTNFALHFAPKIVEAHGGTLIYAGGDDVLALLPTNRVLQCAKKLSDTFRKDWAVDDTGTERLLMGRKATVSAGIAVVHYKEDLRFALDKAREAEKEAKSAGRDAMRILACRRSGEHAGAWCGWEFVDTLQQFVQVFLPDTSQEREGASDRWAYHLRKESGILEGLPIEAMSAEIARLVNRSERETRELLAALPGGGDASRAGELVAEIFNTYAALHVVAHSRTGKQTSEMESAQAAFRDFVTLCQTASFLARGRDQ